MAKFDDMQFFETLLEQEPEQIIEWIKNTQEESSLIPQNFNWLGFAEACLYKVYEDNNLLWATAAIGAYEFLIKTDPEYKERWLLSIMNLKMYLIKRLGSIENDPILDFNQIVQWFFNNLNVSLKYVQKNVDNWMALDIDKIRELRKIKNRLAVFKGLNESLLKPCPELMEWITIQDKLP